MICQKSLVSLVSWFVENRSSYFFREDPSPYKVWVSEVVLQQTRIQAALEPLQRFLGVFPTLEELARGPEEKVVQAFSGLGYYSRARNLYKGARYIQSHFSSFPSTYSELLKVPSIGPYTAAAIASICFQEPVPAVDGNLKRILARTEEWDLPLNSTKLYQKSFKKLQGLFIDYQKHPGELNEAFMELGQKICLPRKPKCSICPIHQFCQAYIHQKTGEYPLPKPEKEWKHVIWRAYLVIENNRILLQKWKDFYFLKGHWSFPSMLEFIKSEKKEKKAKKAKEKKKEKKISRLFSCQPFPFEEMEILKREKHTITHHKIQLQPVLASQTGELPQNSHFQWVHLEQVSRLLAPSALQKIWRIYQASLDSAPLFKDL
ncbi:MAG: A/G-specific adenine glycosylase [Planctomycetota bacterium]|nr:MAG: A/G-specific adenine glycosylase [Planctomycetota bacterium]